MLLSGFFAGVCGLRGFRGAFGGVTAFVKRKAELIKLEVFGRNRLGAYPAMMAGVLVGHTSSADVPVTQETEDLKERGRRDVRLTVRE